MARVEAFCGYPRGRGVSGPAAVLVLSGREEHSWSKTADQLIKIQSMEGGDPMVVVRGA